MVFFEGYEGLLSVAVVDHFYMSGSLGFLLSGKT